jgi:hypothetical protein
MSLFHQYIGSKVSLELSGDKHHMGILIDVGNDILVLYNGLHFIYIPIPHIRHIKSYRITDDTNISNPPANPIDHENGISYRKVLNNARGLFVEIYVAGNQTIHGYVTNVLTDYFVFYSPVYKIMFVPLFHLKWLIPYNDNKTPYSLDKNQFPLNPSDFTPARSFEQQLKKIEGKIVVFDMGLPPNRIGLLKKVENSMVELMTAEEMICCNIQHIKTVHSPYL